MYIKLSRAINVDTYGQDSGVIGKNCENIR